VTVGEELWYREVGCRDVVRESATAQREALMSLVPGGLGSQ